VLTADAYGGLSKRRLMTTSAEACVRHLLGRQHDDPAVAYQLPRRDPRVEALMKSVGLLRRQTEQCEGLFECSTCRLFSALAAAVLGSDHQLRQIAATKA